MTTGLYTTYVSITMLSFIVIISLMYIKIKVLKLHLKQTNEMFHHQGLMNVNNDKIITLQNKTIDSHCEVINAKDAMIETYKEIIKNMTTMQKASDLMVKSLESQVDNLEAGIKETENGENNNEVLPSLQEDIKS